MSYLMLVPTVGFVGSHRRVGIGHKRLLAKDCLQQFHRTYPDLQDMHSSAGPSFSTGGRLGGRGLVGDTYAHGLT
jgi:hypothetical protein